MQNQNRIFSALRGTALATVLAGAATFNLQAQQSVSPSTVSQEPILLAANDLPDANTFNDSSSAVAYSSSVGAAETASAENFIGAADAAGQPPPRRYGRRPVYADSSHNADGSEKYTFFAGVGLTLPTGGTHAYFDPSYSFQVGGGRNFNKNVGVMVQFDWDNFGISSNAHDNQLYLYNSVFGLSFASLSAVTHVWSFTLDPIYNIAQGDKIGAYVVGGVGFYHKVTYFQTPEEVEGCIGFYCGEFEGNANVDDYTSNAVGFNGGFGLTYKPSRFGGERVFAEARYVFVDNSQRTGYSYGDYLANPNSINTFNGSNFFPQNSARTTYIPIKFGVRF